MVANQFNPYATSTDVTTLQPSHSLPTTSGNFTVARTCDVREYGEGACGVRERERWTERLERRRSDTPTRFPVNLVPRRQSGGRAVRSTRCCSADSRRKFLFHSNDEKCLA